MISSFKDKDDNSCGAMREDCPLRFAYRSERSTTLTVFSHRLIYPLGMTEKPLHSELYISFNKPISKRMLALD